MSYFPVVAQIVGTITGFVLALTGSMYVVRESQIRDRRDELQEEIKSVNEVIISLSGKYLNVTNYDRTLLNLDFRDEVTIEQVPAGKLIEDSDEVSVFDKSTIYLTVIEMKLSEAMRETDPEEVFWLVQSAEHDMIMYYSITSDKKGNLDIPAEVSEEEVMEAYSSIIELTHSNILNEEIVKHKPEITILRQSLLFFVVGAVIPILTTVSYPAALTSYVEPNLKFIAEIIHFSITIVFGWFSIIKVRDSLEDVL
ncbi:hypothetical protein PM023_02075 [Halorubrum ezzemoulense]|uniref:hypothetical protein n=1 Tax=Halorubrum ezzemoulense TaxID=337243 RepID=UPI0023301A66|nr:hypothetical protein [Halorubrum ezzemoulense]MDB2223459.1 hypothetical protein [Halorubrum ezzemoulense]